LSTLTALLREGSTAEAPRAAAEVRKKVRRERAEEFMRESQNASRTPRFTTNDQKQKVGPSPWASRPYSRPQSLPCLSLPNGKVMFLTRLASLLEIQEIPPELPPMPWRYLLFFLLVLILACSASRHLASTQVSHEKTSLLPTAPSAGKAAVPVKVSGRSIAPGGAGGRQS
jgi:hypothetical protein